MNYLGGFEAQGTRKRLTQRFVPTVAGNDSGEQVTVRHCEEERGRRGVARRKKRSLLLVVVGDGDPTSRGANGEDWWLREEREKEETDKEMGE